MLTEYISTYGDMYIFPVGFIENNDVLKNEKDIFESWCKTVTSINRTEPIGITWSGGDSFTFWRKSEWENTTRNRIWVNEKHSSYVLGGL